MITVDVQVREAPYKIYLGEGILDRLAEEISAQNPSSVLVVTNVTVGVLYAKKVCEISSKICRTEVVYLPDGERYKSWAAFSEILEALAQMKADRHSLVIALGGGVVGDMAGFAAATYMRGIDFIQVPTTLLALVDSSVGGKTGMNMRAGKNLLGAFHQPKAVIADTAFLTTLPRREVSAGLAEIIKHGLLADAKYFDEIERDIDKLTALDHEVVARVVARSCQIKAAVVSRDAKEKGERAKLNLGHTFGHAIEKLAGYGTWLHGEAVACGLVLAARASQKLGKISSSDVQRIIALVKRAGLPTEIPGISLSKAIEAMKSDKKSSGGVIRFVLLNAIGEAYVDELPENILEEVLLEGGFVK